jgi:hypothetical protein
MEDKEVLTLILGQFPPDTPFIVEKRIPSLFLHLQ